MLTGSLDSSTIAPLASGLQARHRIPPRRRASAPERDWEAPAGPSVGRWSKLAGGAQFTGDGSMTFEYFKEVARWRGGALVHRIRKGLGLLPRPLPEEKSLVFGIGMHRTGTRSLCEYLDDLGFHSLHWPHWCEWDLKHHLRDDNDKIMRLLDPLFYRYDCFTDVPFAGLYRELDRRFPRGRFILTVRDSETWWRSVVRHWGLAANGSRPLDPGETIQYRLYEPAGKTRISLDDKETQIAKFERHNSDVQEHFAGRPGKLLVVDLRDPEKNVKISAFLGSPVKPYPHVQDQARRP